MTEIEVRSYQRVFNFERRIYRIDTLRLNPAGVPIRGIAYAAVAILGALALRSVPLFGALWGRIPWYVADLALPCSLAALLTLVRIEGRTFHLAAVALARHLSERHGARIGRRQARAWRPPPVLCIPDGSDARFRALRYRGPGVALVSLAHERREWHGRRRRALSLRELGTGTLRTPCTLAVEDGVVLEIEPWQ